jgi:hypothetical protein
MIRVWVDDHTYPFVAAPLPVFFGSTVIAFICALFPRSRSNRQLPQFDNLLRRVCREDVHGSGNGSRPTGLVAGAETGSIVAVKVFVKLEIVAPIRIALLLDRLRNQLPIAAYLARDTRGL